MKHSGPFCILVSCVAGFLGGTLSTRNQAQAARPDVVRASKFELVNAVGAPVAAWEADSRNEIHIRFLSNGRTPVLEFGLRSDGLPYLRMNGHDGKYRIGLELIEGDRPILSMGDEKWEGRVHLGFIAPDMTTPGWDNWGLLFRAPGSERPVSSLGMMKTETGTMEGLLTISGKRILQ